MEKEIKKRIELFKNNESIKYYFEFDDDYFNEELIIDLIEKFDLTDEDIKKIESENYYEIIIKNKTYYLFNSSDSREVLKSEFDEYLEVLEKKNYNKFAEIDLEKSFENYLESYQFECEELVNDFFIVEKEKINNFNDHFKSMYTDPQRLENYIIDLQEKFNKNRNRNSKIYITSKLDYDDFCDIVNEEENIIDLLEEKGFKEIKVVEQFFLSKIENFLNSEIH